jgi:hypothetical protein
LISFGKEKDTVRPTTEEILKGIKFTLKEVIVPDLRSPWPRWMAEQIDYFIDHLVLRYQEEPQMLLDENRELREILSQAEGVFRTVGLVRSDAPLIGLADEIKEQLQDKPQEKVEYTPVPLMQEKNNRLKSKLCEAIKAIESAQEEREIPSLNEVREKIRTYMKKQVKREAPLMHSLFGVKRDAQSS